MRSTVSNGFPRRETPMKVLIHPQIDAGQRPAAANFAGGTLHCRCAVNRVAVSIKGQVLHNHVCGCTKCWKPPGALFSQVGAVPRDNLKVTAHEEKLQLVDPATPVKRYACTACGTHMYAH